MFLILELARHILNISGRIPVAYFSNWLIFLLFTAFIFSLSWIFYFFTERHTFALRKKVYERITNTHTISQTTQPEFPSKSPRKSPNLGD